MNDKRAELAEYLAYRYGLAHWETEQIVEIVIAAMTGKDYTKMPARKPLLEPYKKEKK